MRNDPTTPSAQVGSPLHRGFARPIDEPTASMLVQLMGVLIAAAGVGGWVAVVAGGVLDLAAHPLLLIAVSATAVILGPMVTAAARFGPRHVHRWLSPLVAVLLVAATFLVTAAHYAVGPPSIAVVVLYVEAPIFAVYLFRRPLAIAVYVLVDAQFGFVVTTQPGYAFPLVQFLFFAVVLASIGGIIGGLLAHGVAEAQRLARFRRFLAQPVADAVLAAGDDEMLEPHRRRIAVFFCDLRGFTRFSTASEPEEVVEVLDDYYHTVGELLHEHGATVGSFAGDGIMAYFGDPVRIDDPAERAVELALQLRGPMDALMRDWKRRGFELSYGIGIAYGYATLGVVGFKGRYDYTALGSVVNLAARLSDQADACEVLVDERTFQALDVTLDATPRTLTLKGFDAPVTARCIARPPSAVIAFDRQRSRPA